MSYRIPMPPRSARRVFAAAALCAALAPRMAFTQAAAAPGFVVIVNAANPAVDIERETLSRIFFKRPATWPSGRSASPVDLTVQLPAREEFTRVIHHKSVSAVRAFWQQQIFSGRDVPPPEKASINDAVAAVRENPDAVAYVPAATALPEGVRVLPVRGDS